MPALLGILLLASAGAIRAADSESTTPNSSVSASTDYYDYGDDVGMVGGTLEYCHALRQGGTLHLGLTALNGSSTHSSSASNFASTTEAKQTEFRLDALYTHPAVSWLAIGLEYIRLENDVDSTSYYTYKHLVDKGTPGRPDMQWDGTYYTKTVYDDSDSASMNCLMLKTTLTGPDWHLYRGATTALTLTPSLDAGIGYLLGGGDEDADDKQAGAILAAKVRVAYEFGGSTLFLDGGYRYWGELDSLDDGAHGCFGRAGYSYRW